MMSSHSSSGAVRCRRLLAQLSNNIGPAQCRSAVPTSTGAAAAPSSSVDASSLPVEDSAAKSSFVAYCEEGTRRAAELGNRGPIRFDEDGNLAPDIVEAYWRCGFYVFENVLAPEEVSDLQADFDAVLENAPAEMNGRFDVLGRPVRHPDCYTMHPTLGDPWGGTNVAHGRHPLKMREHARPDGAPEVHVGMVNHPLDVMDACLRVYGHPELLKVAEAINGKDFTPFTESVFHKPAGLGASSAWHQDGFTHWDVSRQTDWVSPAWHVGCHGFSFHLAFSDCNAEGCMWVLPGSQHEVADVKGLAAAGGNGDLLPGAVPMLMKAGDVGMHNRNVLHGAFSNTSAQRRVTMVMGFHRRGDVLNVETANIHNGKGFAGKHAAEGNKVIYDEEWIHERSRIIQLAIDARKQKYPLETPYVYRPLVGEEDRNRWTPQAREDLLKGYWRKNISI